ncbi:MAG: endonuclease V [Thermoplasmata archaeon]|nr:methylated-DNA--[protein]-cysteine S-methyltransferase [Euryarchaeota archaeon]
MEINLYNEFYSLVKQIPKGRVTTYGDLALALGDIVASRAVGKMLSENPKPMEIPCHRVVMSDGSLGGFTHPESIIKKIEILRNEGVEIINGKIKDFAKIRFNDFKSNYPLKKLWEEEENIKKKISLNDRDFDKIVAIDVSYEGRNAFISSIVVDRNFSLLKKYVKITNVDFPYIPTYLSYREGRAIIRTIDEEALYVLDGQGILHPRGIGLATYVGILKNVPSLGIAKSRLVGEIIEGRIYLNGLQVGWKIGKYHISPGNLISLEKSIELGKDIIKSGILNMAHNLATRSRNQYSSSNNGGPFP